MMIRTEMFLNKLKASLVFSAKKNIRYCLEGVQLEVMKDKVLLVSTDGYRLCVIKHDVDNEIDETVSVILSKGLIESVVNSKDFDKDLPVEITFDLQRKPTIVEMSQGNKVKFEAESLDGKYPVWRDIIPKGESLPTKLISAKVEYIGDLGKVNKILNRSKYAGLSIGMSDKEQGSLICNVDDECFCLIMSMRSDVNQVTAPIWVK